MSQLFNRRRASLSLGAVASVALLGASHASAQISGFSSATDQINGSPSNIFITGGGALQLTTAGGGNVADTDYNKTAQAVTGGYTATFTWDLAGPTNGGNAPPNNADGFTFVVQNLSLSPASANGGSGTGRGNPLSGNGVIGVSIEDFSNGPGLYLDENSGITHIGGLGNTGGTQTGSVNFAAVDTPINITITYNGANTIGFSAVQGANSVSTNLTLSATEAADLASNGSTTLGAGLAYVGFGGSTGGLSETQQVSNYTFTPAGSPVPEPASLGIIGLGSLGLLARRRKV